MIVTFLATARSRAARRSPRPISRGFARSAVKGLPWCLRRTPNRSATQSSRYQASARSVNARESPGSGDHLSPAWRQAWVRREGSHGRIGDVPKIQGGCVMSAHVAIVAGAGGALGHATAATLAASGRTVVAVDRNEHALRGPPRRCPPRGGRHHRPRRGERPHRPDRRRGWAARRAGEHHRCVPARRRAHHDSRDAAAHDQRQPGTRAVAEPGGSAAYAAAGLRCHRAHSRPPGDRAIRWHGGLQREQGRSCPPDTHPRYRAPPARDPGERGRAATARHPRQPGHHSRPR